MAAIDAAAVAALLVELGRRMALTGDNYFRAKAYQRAADTLSALVEPLDRVIAENRLRQLPGIGETIADIITKLQRTGTHPLLDKLRKDIPEGVLDMLSIPGLKPDKINIIHRELGITDLAALEAAAREDRLKQVKGLGAAVQRKILEGLKIRETALGARHLHRADELARSAAETLERSVPGVIRTVTAGDLRRGGELVSNLAVVAEVERLRRGVELGCKFSINPDAHSTSEIASSTRWGLAIARKSGMPADRVINTLDRDSFARWLYARKERAAPRLARARKTQPA